MRFLWDLLFLHFFFAQDILTLISASASASDSNSEELSELEELSSDSDEEVLLSEEFESDCSSTLAIWTRPLLDFFFFLDLFFGFFFFVLEVLQVSLRPLLLDFLIA